MAYIAKNDAYSALAGAITEGDAQATLQPGDGDRFPVIEDPDYTLATLEDDFGNREIIRITLRQAASDSISFLRAQEGSVARAWPSGTIIEVRPTAALMNSAIAHFDQDVAAHAATAVSVETIGSLSADNVQDALAELAAEKADANSLNAESIAYDGGGELPASTVNEALDALDLRTVDTNDVVAALDASKQDNIGFTPVQQGTGAGQLPNTVKLGWSGTRLKAEVDADDLGNLVTDEIMQSPGANSQGNKYIGPIAAGAPSDDFGEDGDLFYQY